MDLPFRYVMVGLIWLVAAMIEGLWMGIFGTTQYTPLHVIMVLTGGVTGILFGTVLRAWVKVGSDPWANWQFIAWNIGVLVTAVGAIVRVWGHGDAVIAIGSIVMLVATLMLLVMFQRGGNSA
jgi:hypothetical protein